MSRVTRVGCAFDGAIKCGCARLARGTGGYSGAGVEKKWGGCCAAADRRRSAWAIAASGCRPSRQAAGRS
eukprot:608944-Prymnesium_polylepis.1